MLENQAMSLELQKIKKRYKQFRELLEQVESRDKAEIVSENLKLKKVQTEISSELETLREENEKLKTRLGEKDRDLLKLKVCYHRTKFLTHLISRNFFINCLQGSSQEFRKRTSVMKSTIKSTNPPESDDCSTCIFYRQNCEQSVWIRQTLFFRSYLSFLKYWLWRQLPIYSRNFCDTSAERNSFAF